jgi:hypothetical protein
LRKTVVAAGLVAIAAAVFGPVVGHGFVNWDDGLYVTENPSVDPAQPADWRLLLTPSLNYPVPVPIAAYRAVASVFGFDPAAFHSLNLALHLVNVLLVFLLLSRWVGPGRAAVGALVWAIHPLQVETVAWCTETKDLLYAGFAVIALLANGHALGEGTRHRGWLALVAVAGVLAVLSKPSACVVPVALVLHPLLTGRGRILRSPAFLLAYGAPAVAAAGVAAVAVTLSVRHEAIVPGHFLTAWYFSGLLQAVAVQATHVVAPFDLLPFYVRWTGLSAWSLPHVAGIAVVAGLALVAARTWRRPDPLPRFLLALFVLLYLPVSGLAPIQRFVADSYMYVPLVPLVGLACAVVPRGWPARPWARKAAFAALATVVCLLAVASRRQVAIWESSRTLWTPAYERYPMSHVVFRHYADAWTGPAGPERPLAVTPALVEATVSEGALDATMAAYFAQSLPPEQVLPLFERLYRDGARDQDLHRNFAAFVHARRPVLDGYGRECLRGALDALAAGYAWRGEEGALSALKRLAEANGLDWTPPRQFDLDHTWSK